MPLLLLVLSLFLQDGAVREQYEKKRLEAPQTARGQTDLGRWCERVKLREEAVKAYERAIEIDPDFADARKALGHKKVLGRWTSDKNYADPSWWAHPKVEQKKVDAAVVRGGEWLLNNAHKLPEISHTIGSLKLRMEELVLLTLLESGWDRKDPRLTQLMQRVLSLPLDRTYHVSLRAMCLAAIDPLKYQQQLAQCAQYLVDNQADNGGWGYGQPTAIPASFPAKEQGPVQIETGNGGVAPAVSKLKQIELKKLKPVGETMTDNSNAQYAALGLRACLSGLVVVPKETIQAAESYWEKNQRSDGGWAYSGTGANRVPDDKSYGSMTAGAVGSLVIFKYYRSRVWRQAADWKGADSIKRGVEWLGKELDYAKNPNAPYNAWQYYWFYAVERAGRLLETEQFAAKEWYPLGADPLMGRQSADGSWTEEKWDAPGGTMSAKFMLAPGVTTETCFALLFLRRATPKTDETIQIKTGSAASK